LAISTTCGSKSPQVLGFVSMMAATSGPSSAVTSSTCTQPSSRAGTGFTTKPMSAAVAGFVPWAESGTSTVRRVAPSPLASMAALIAIMPQSSPWAPAFGESATAVMLVRVRR
jgi:hypothetical protein